MERCLTKCNSILLSLLYIILSLQVTFQQEWTAIILCILPQVTKKKVYHKLKQFYVSIFFFFLVATRILTNFTRTSRTKWISFMKTHKSFIRMEQDYFFVLISQFTGKAREFRACLLFTWREKHWFMRELHFTCSITECSLKNLVKIIECHADWVNISY